MLVGDGPAETYIKSMAAQLIEGHVIFMGRVDRRNLYLVENAEVRKRLACNGPRFINRERNLHQNLQEALTRAPVDPSVEALNNPAFSSR